MVKGGKTYSRKNNFSEKMNKPSWNELKISNSLIYYSIRHEDIITAALIYTVNIGTCMSVVKIKEVVYWR